MGSFAQLWDLLRQALGLVLPLFARSQDYRGLAPAVRWVVHAVLVVLVLAALGAVNVWGRLDGVLGRGAPAWLKQTWLPCLFLLVYALSWLGWCLWRLAWPEQEASDFPDIDGAWDEALATLYHAGIDPTAVPLFLLLGRPAAGEATLFGASQLQFTVPGAPDHPEAPLHVYACPEGIFVTCPGASLLGRQADLFAAAPDEDGRRGETVSDTLDDADDRYKTVDVSESLKEVQAILRRARDQGRGLTEEERHQVRRLRGLNAAAGASSAGPRTPLLNDPAEIELFAARFKYLCGLLVRDRRPYCPVNGILMLLPLAAADGEDVAEHVAALCQLDLAAGREVLQLHCPVFGLLCDLEAAPGFVAFLERFPAEQRQRRLGQRFPLVPDLPAEEVPPVLERLVRWVCQDLFAIWVYRLFRAETPEQPDAAAAVHGNALLYQLLRHMHALDRPLAGIVARGLGVPHHGLSLFGGCYMAGTGAGPGQQGFVAGVFRRLIESQNYVSWTEEGLAEEADYERWTRRGYLALGMLALAVAAVLGLLYYLPPGR
jgi:hypothetical protein